MSKGRCVHDRTGFGGGRWYESCWILGQVRVLSDEVLSVQLRRQLGTVGKA